MSQDMLTKVKKIEDIGRSNLAHLVFRIIGSANRNNKKAARKDIGLNYE